MKPEQRKAPAKAEANQKSTSSIARVIDFEKLTKEIPHRWRVQSFSKFKASCSCIAYIDARDAMNLLDEVVGPENWQDKYESVNGKFVAGVGINTTNGWVWKWDTGTESHTEAEKGQFSDAFKRACVKWGIGRFLYNLDVVYIDTNKIKSKSDEPWDVYPVDKSGKKIWDVTEYINKTGKGTVQTDDEVTLVGRVNNEPLDNQAKCEICGTTNEYHKKGCPNQKSL